MFRREAKVDESQRGGSGGRKMEGFLGAAVLTAASYEAGYGLGCRHLNSVILSREL